MNYLVRGLLGSSFLVAAGLAMSGPASAQTVSSSRSDAVAPVFSWQGFYAGVIGGYGHMRAEGSAAHPAGPDITTTTFFTSGSGTFTFTDTVPGAPADAANFSMNDESWFLGAEAGYDHDLGPVVVGGVVDLAGSGMSGRTIAGDSAIKVGLDWFGTARVRIGLPIDRFLVYGTGGLAIGGIKTDLSTPLGATSDRFTKVGWAAGAGVSYAVTEKVVLDLSYLHLGFGSHSVSGAAGRAKVKLSNDLIRFGVSYKFD
ncbi:outer membrane protein [Labrys sp. 22185]|uniref:outer membrane protein n=1 Tax=Labrys sp. 22185 TaxID=3453888 RepID=UPI003F85DBC8